jgi:hypothetical protein
MTLCKYIFHYTIFNYTKTQNWVSPFIIKDTSFCIENMPMMHMLIKQYFPVLCLCERYGIPSPKSMKEVSQENIYLDLIFKDHLFYYIM